MIIYSCAEFRSISGPTPRRLQPWEECWGMLQDLRGQESSTLTIIAGLLVALPPELRAQLDGLIGRKIAILRTDEDFKLRVIDGL